MPGAPWGSCTTSRSCSWIGHRTRGPRLPWGDNWAPGAERRDRDSPGWGPPLCHSPGADPRGGRGAELQHGAQFLLGTALQWGCDLRQVPPPSVCAMAPVTPGTFARSRGNRVGWPWNARNSLQSPLGQAQGSHILFPLCSSSSVSISHSGIEPGDIPFSAPPQRHWLDIWEKCQAEKEVKRWPRLPRAVVETPSLEVSKKMGLCGTLRWV